MEDLMEAKQETTLGLVAKELTQTDKAHRLGSNYKSFLARQLSVSFLYLLASGSVSETGLRKTHRLVLIIFNESAALFMTNKV